MGRILDPKKIGTISRKLGVSCIMVDKNTPAYKFQSLRKEDLYKKGRKGIFLNYVFFIGTLIFSNSKKMHLRTSLNYFHLKMDIVINKNARNLLVLKTIQFKNNNNKIWQ